MNQGARNKLRNMGGIMASSPKLMQAAFQPGGPVMPMPPLAPRTSGVTRPGTGAPLVGLGRVPPMMPQPITPGRFVAGQPSDPSVADGFFGLDPVRPAGLPGLADQGAEEQDIISELIDGSGAGSLPGGLGRRGRRSSPSYTQEDVDAVSPNRARSGVPEPTLEDAQNLENRAEELRESGNPRSEATARRLLREAEEVRNRKATEESQASRDEYFQQGGPSGLSALATPIQTSMDDPETVERMQTQLQKVIEENQETTDDTDTDTDTPAAPSKKDLRSRYKEKLELFKEIYGEDDEDRARDKAMSLAMLGLAIASGQSPDFLTNVTQGTMAGLQGMSEQERARRERDRGLQTLALETAIGEQSAEAEAAAAAEDRIFDRETKLLVEDAKNRSGRSNVLNRLGAGRLDEEALSQAATEYKDGLLPVPEGVEPADAMAARANEIMRRRISLDVADGLMTAEQGETILSVLGGSPSLKTTGFNAAEQATVDAAKTKLAQNPANRSKIAQKLTSVGIDPGVLGDG